MCEPNGNVATFYGIESIENERDVCVRERKCVSLCTKIQIENLSRIENIKSFDKPYRMCVPDRGYACEYVCECVRAVCNVFPLRCFSSPIPFISLTFSYNSNDVAILGLAEELCDLSIKLGQVV